MMNFNNISISRDCTFGLCMVLNFLRSWEIVIINAVFILIVILFIKN